MDVTDQDMQMVRDFLKEAKAPFHIASHFENLVSEYGKEADRASDLKDRVESLEAEADDCDDLKHEIAGLQEELDDLKRAETAALETVKYWLLDVLVHGRPMQTPPRAVLRIVEEAL